MSCRKSMSCPSLVKSWEGSLPSIQFCWQRCSARSCWWWRWWSRPRACSQTASWWPSTRIHQALFTAAVHNKCNNCVVIKTNASDNICNLPSYKFLKYLSNCNQAISSSFDTWNKITLKQLSNWLRSKYKIPPRGQACVFRAFYNTPDATFDLFTQYNILSPNAMLTKSGIEDTTIFYFIGISTFFSHI